jgi:hypothetical protein
LGFFAPLRPGEKIRITRIVNGLDDDDHAKSPRRKEAWEYLVGLGYK